MKSSAKAPAKMAAPKVRLSTAKTKAKASASPKSAANGPAKTAKKKPAEPIAERVVLTLEEGVAKTADAEEMGRRTARMLDVLRLHRVEVSLSFVGDETIAELNEQWRHKKGPTDVLSFPLHDVPAGALLDPNVQAALSSSHAAESGSTILLGDIVVSIPTAKRQAAEHDKKLLDEVTWLVAHGLLHLLGFDHEDDSQEREMDAYARVLEASALNESLPRLALVPIASLIGT